MFSGGIGAVTTVIVELTISVAMDWLAGIVNVGAGVGGVDGVVIDIGVFGFFG